MNMDIAYHYISSFSVPSLIDSIPQIERQRDIELAIVESPMSGHSFRVSSIILKQRSASATQAVVLLHNQPLWNFAFQ